MKQPLDLHTHAQIITLLTPLMTSEAERCALMISAFYDESILTQMEYGGAVGVFVPRLMELLQNYGTLTDGRPALWALLETVREQVGLEQKHLIDSLRPSFNLPPPPRLDKLFVSYSRQNERDAQRIVSNLKDAGLRVWYDREKIKGGVNWWETIVRGITYADYFVYHQSRSAMPWRGMNCSLPASTTNPFLRSCWSTVWQN